MEKLPLMRGDRVAVLSVCGGLGIVCVERLLASYELRLARFSDQTVKGLKSSLAPTATVGKLDGYVDMTGSVTERTHFEALSAILEQDGVDGVIFLTTPPNFLPEEGWAREVANAFAQQLSPKPVIVVLGFGDMAPDSRRVLEDSGIPVVDFPDLAVDIMENLAFYSRWRRANESRAKPMTAD
jgi:acetyltransferase